MADLYGLSLDELVTFDMETEMIQEAIERTSDAITQKIDWTKAWSKKYLILAVYQKEVETGPYAVELTRLLEDLEKKYGYGEQDALLVLKDILASVWKGRRKKK